MNNDKCAGCECDVCRKCQENESLVRGYEWLAHEVGADNEDGDNDLTDFLLSMSPEDALKVTAQIRKDIQRALCCDVRVGDNEQRQLLLPYIVCRSSRLLGYFHTQKSLNKGLRKSMI